MQFAVDIDAVGVALVVALEDRERRQNEGRGADWLAKPEKIARAR
jgi:hypothetical protein